MDCTKRVCQVRGLQMRVPCDPPRFPVEHGSIVPVDGQMCIVLEHGSQGYVFDDSLGSVDSS